MMRQANNGVAMYAFACSLPVSTTHPPPMNKPTPTSMRSTLRYFFRGYFFPMSAPMSMTGTGLQLLASTCMEKMTYRNARTLKKVLPMLVSHRTANWAGGMVLEPPQKAQLCTSFCLHDGRVRHPNGRHDADVWQAVAEVRGGIV